MIKYRYMLHRQANGRWKGFLYGENQFEPVCESGVEYMTPELALIAVQHQASLIGIKP